MRIAVDVLGGDHAPREVLRGVAAALRTDFEAGQLVLAGPESVVRDTLREEGVSELPEIADTDVVVEGHEKPVEALRNKPNSSIALCVGAVREGRAQGLISFGNTGAAVAASTVGLGMLEGIRRPGIAVVWNSLNGKVVLLDAGANPTPKPLHLYQYGIMGAAYARDILKIQDPRVGLLNIGGEAGKGSQVAKEAHELISRSGVHFVGNVEGQDLFLGEADVHVTDGFVGNMVLKVVEGFAEFLQREVAKISSGDSSSMRDLFRRLVGAADFSEVGGAILLGVNGVVFIGHGRSDSRAVPPALRAVRADIEAGVNEHITETLLRTNAAAGLGAPDPGAGGSSA